MDGWIYFVAAASAVYGKGNALISRRRYSASSLQLICGPCRGIRIVVHHASRLLVIHLKWW
jgi:hypothetical protein